MKGAATVWFLMAGTAAANPALLDFMGGQGCTFGADSRAAAIEAGFAEADIDTLITDALAKGTAKREGDYVVLAEAVCTIRLPEITSLYSVTSPEIVAVTSSIDEYAADGLRGCYLFSDHEDIETVFYQLDNGEKI